MLCQMGCRESSDERKTGYQCRGPLLPGLVTLPTLSGRRGLCLSSAGQMRLQVDRHVERHGVTSCSDTNLLIHFQGQRLFIYNQASWHRAATNSCNKLSVKCGYRSGRKRLWQNRVNVGSSWGLMSLLPSVLCAVLCEPTEKDPSAWAFTRPFTPNKNHVHVAGEGLSWLK